MPIALQFYAMAKIVPERTFLLFADAPPVANLNFTGVFATVFFSVLGLTLISLVGAFILVLLPKEKQTPAVATLLETCSTAFKLGCGAIFGLLGGKAL